VKLLLLALGNLLANYKLSYAHILMMFSMLTHDNQSTLLSFSLFLSFVTISTVTEKTLSGSTDVGLLESKTWQSFQSYQAFFRSLKRTHFHDHCL